MHFDRIGTLKRRSIATLALLILVMVSLACNGQPPTTSLASPHANDVAESDVDGLIASPEPDWPQWRGPRRDGIADEKDLLPAWPEAGPKLLWQVDNLGLGWSSPVIVGNRLSITGDVGDDLVIFAFDLNGKLVWQAKNGKAWTGPYPGARACCVYSEGKLYQMNAHSRVACLDAATGAELWACDLRERFEAVDITWGYSECLLVDGPRLIVTPGGGKALMAALDKESGRTLWMTEPLVGDRASHASPILFHHDRRILASCSSSHGFGVDADTGKLLWTVPLKSPYKVNVTTPVYYDGSIFYVTAYASGACYRLRPGEDGAFSPEKAWSTTLDSCTGAALLVGDKLFGSGYQKHKSWLCIDWESGKTQYEFKGLSTSSAVYANGRFYCLNVDGRAALLKPTPERLEIVGQFRLVPEKTIDAWAYPVVLHGRLYLRYHDTFKCYDVRAK